MRIGISTNLLDTSGYGRFGEQMYEKLIERGYSCTDYSMSGTETHLYTLPWEEAAECLNHEKKLAQKAGIEIWQVHSEKPVLTVCFRLKPSHPPHFRLRILKI